MSASSSFECAICMEYYNAEANVPTSFPCGHSCCLRHTAAMMICHVCRRKLPDELTVNISLRDGAVEMMERSETLEKLKKLLLAATTPGHCPADASRVSSPESGEVNLIAETDALAVDLINTTQASTTALESPFPLPSAELGLEGESAPVNDDILSADDVACAPEVSVSSSPDRRKKRSNKKKKKKKAPVDAEANARAVALAEMVAEGVLSAEAAALKPMSDEYMFRDFSTIPVVFANAYIPATFDRLRTVLESWYFAAEVVSDALLTRPRHNLFEVVVSVVDKNGTIGKLHAACTSKDYFDDFCDKKVVAGMTLLVPLGFLVVGSVLSGPVAEAFRLEGVEVVAATLEDILQTIEIYRLGETSLCWNCKVAEKRCWCGHCRLAGYCSKVCCDAHVAVHVRHCRVWPLLQAWNARMTAICDKVDEKAVHQIVDSK